MSRIIVKGLPKYLNEDRLLQHFSKRLQQKHQNGSDDLITDVKIMKNNQGESRRFAFVGFRNEEDAFDAVDYFNGSFVDTSKIEVSMAKSFADPKVPMPMREKRREALKRLREREEKLLEESNMKKQKNDEGKKSKPSIDAEIEKNKQLQEFIETMKPSSQTVSWDTLGGLASKNSEAPSLGVQDAENAPQANSLLAHALALQGQDDGKGKEGGAFKLPENDSDDEYTAFGENEAVQEGDGETAGMMGLDAFESNNENTENIAQDDKVSDLDWLKQRSIRIREGEDEEAKPKHIDANEGKEEAEDQMQEKSQEKEEEKEVSQEEKAIQQIKSTGRLFIRNILYTAKESDFKQLFSPYGELEEVHVALDTRTGQSKGFAYIMFKNPENAVNAYIELDKQIFQGRLLHILPAEAKKSHRLDEFDLKNLPLKKQRELKRKANASQQTFSWNSLYMNQDAVLSSVASKLGMEKSELIDPTNSGSAVKQALAEAHVIGDVRKFFESRGVDLTKFVEYKSPSERDECVILVKNFPFGTTKEELAELFLPFGKLQRLLMPPAGTIAIVQFRDMTAARAAFTKMSYKRFKDGIMYLEKGPKNCFTREPQGDELVDNSNEPQEDVKEAKLNVDDLMDSTEPLAKGDDKTDVVDDVIDGPTVSIFIKNLNFSTTSKQLSDRFRAFNGFVVAQVKTKPDPKHSGKTLSMGFGFAEFKTKEQAMAVISAMDGTVLEGHKIQLKLSHRQGATANSSGKTSKKNNNGKILVKNLPFEATRKDVFELFSSFGQLKSVRVPKKFDKTARGFAFVEFLLPKEAENAMDQLHGVHLLGRRLVMQYAEQESDDAEEQIAKMTKRVRKQVATREFGAMRNSGKRKLDLDDEQDENDGLNGF